MRPGDPGFHHMVSRGEKAITGTRSEGYGKARTVGPGACSGQIQGQAS